MRVTVPEDLGTDLRKLEGVAEAQIDSLMPGKSKSGHPKATLKWIVTEEMDGIADSEESTIGEPVLETFSLQPQALWKLNNLYKEVTGERLPQGDYEIPEFIAMVEEGIVGKKFHLVLELKVPEDGSSTDPRTEVTSRTFVG